VGDNRILAATSLNHPSSEAAVPNCRPNCRWSGAHRHRHRLETWYSLGDAAPGTGLWRRNDLLAEPAGGVIPRIAHGVVTSSELLGRKRWAAQRTLSWLNRYRRLNLRYACRIDLLLAFLLLTCCLPAVLSIGASSTNTWDEQQAPAAHPLPASGASSS
jgi:transposase